MSITPQMKKKEGTLFFKKTTQFYYIQCMKYLQYLKNECVAYSDAIIKVLCVEGSSLERKQISCTIPIPNFLDRWTRSFTMCLNQSQLYPPPKPRFFALCSRPHRKCHNSLPVLHTCPSTPVILQPLLRCHPFCGVFPGSPSVSNSNVCAPAVNSCRLIDLCLCHTTECVLKIRSHVIVMFILLPPSTMPFIEYMSNE